MADVLRSTALTDAGFAHAFSLREGGVSDAPFGTLNLGRAVGDEEECVWENHIRFAARVPYPRDELYEVSQVHGVSVRVVALCEDPVVVRQEQHDALIAPAGGLAVGVRTADCVPILLADTVTGGVADAFQLFTRPVARWNPYSTPNPRVFMCSAATPPGGGVHGMCGFYAAEGALRRLARVSQAAPLR